MSDDGFLWGEAEVTYPDWVGTAQLDERMTISPDGTSGLEEKIGLDADQWQIIGIDIGGGENTHHLKVIAVPRDSLPEGGHVLPRMAAEQGGEVQATEFEVHDVDPYEMLRAITHVFALRLRWSSSVNVPIRVMAFADLPEQEWQD